MMRESRTILVAEEMLDEMGQAIMRGVLTAASAAPGWHLARMRVRPWDAVIESLRGQQYAGAIVHAAADRIVHALVRVPVPVISTSNSPLEPALPRVSTDDTDAGRAAARHLRGSGYRHGVFIHPRSATRYSQQRFAGMREVLGDTHVTELTGGDAISRWGRRCRTVVRSQSGPVALVGATDGIATMACEWASRERLHVPGDVGVMGINGEMLRCELNHPPLTSVELPFEQIGATAFNLLTEAIRTGSALPAETSIAALGVVERQSTSLQAIDDADLREVIAAIHANHGVVALSELLKRVPVTRKALEMKFKRYTGQTPHQYILRVRAEHARRLLIETRMSVTEIAYACGFSTPSRMGTLFRKLYGSTPTQVRRALSLSG